MKYASGARDTNFNFRLGRCLSFEILMSVSGVSIQVFIHVLIMFRSSHNTVETLAESYWYESVYIPFILLEYVLKLLLSFENTIQYFEHVTVKLTEICLLWLKVGATCVVTCQRGCRAGVSHPYLREFKATTHSFTV